MTCVDGGPDERDFDVKLEDYICMAYQELKNQLLLRDFFRLVPRELVYVPTPGKYFGTSLDAKCCMGIVFEEFDNDVFQPSVSQIKRLL